MERNKCGTVHTSRQTHFSHVMFPLHSTHRTFHRDTELPASGKRSPARGVRERPPPAPKEIFWPNLAASGTFLRHYAIINTDLNHRLFYWVCLHDCKHVVNCKESGFLCVVANKACKELLILKKHSYSWLFRTFAAKIKCRSWKNKYTSSYISLQKAPLHHTLFLKHDLGHLTWVGIIGQKQSRTF